MRDLLCSEFQEQVDQCLVRHRSILDVLTKLQEGPARINRAVTKSVTNCGCLSITASKQQMPLNDDLDSLRSYLASHLDGELCANCREVVEDELGHTFFYMAALCNLLDLNLYDVLIKEHQRMRTLGIFKLS